ncbi:MAG: hypothetical protein CL949_13750 [Erythrobacter sp.]|nr:hypothetical protein [Erythrobacter sp.]|tara:strand:+ start:303 stop:563 length:261 start_codon:yes stop_codon:yes gene_type:complete
MSTRAATIASLASAPVRAHVRQITNQGDCQTGGKTLDNIIECDLPADDDEKVYAAARRRLLRSIDQQIDDLLSGHLTEIVLVSTPA